LSEDVGGILGFCECFEAIADPKNPDRCDRIEWCGGTLDPADMGADCIRKHLACIAARHKRAATKRTT